MANRTGELLEWPLLRVFLRGDARFHQPPHGSIPCAGPLGEGRALDGQRAGGDRGGWPGGRAKRHGPREAS